MIRHFVHLRFAANTSRHDKLALYKDLAALDGHIDGILDFQYRENVSVETPLVRDFKDMFWLDFDSETTRDTYLNDAQHKAIGNRIVASLEGGADGVFVCDIEV